MKKLFVTFLALTVLGLPAFAQVSKRPMSRELNEELNRAVLEVIAKHPQKNEKLNRAVLEAIAKHPQKVEAVVENLQNFREVTTKRKEFNGSFILQSMTGLMDSYIALANESESAAVALNEEINQPIKAGWGQTVTIPQLIRDNIQHVFPGTSTADDFDRFEFLLGKKAVSQAEKQINDKQTAVLNSLASFRGVTEKRKEFNGSYSLQDMMDLMDNYLALYQTSESEALALNKEINKPIKAGWGQTVTIPQLIRENIQHVFAGSSTAYDLEFFADVLGKDVK